MIILQYEETELKQHTINNKKGQKKTYTSLAFLRVWCFISFYHQKNPNKIDILLTVKSLFHKLGNILLKKV